MRVVHNQGKVLGMIRCDCRRRFSHVRSSVYAELEANDQVVVEALGDSSDPGQSAPRNNIYGYTYTHFSGVLLFLSHSPSMSLWMTLEFSSFLCCFSFVLVDKLVQIKEQLILFLLSRRVREEEKKKIQSLRRISLDLFISLGNRCSKRTKA